MKGKDTAPNSIGEMRFGEEAGTLSVVTIQPLALTRLRLQPVIWRLI